MSRYLRASAFVGVLLATGALLSGCSIMTVSDVSRVKVTTVDPRTPRALLRIAIRFNQDYGANRVGPVYDRWDAPSQTIISRAQYVKRHIECPTSPGPAIVDGVSPTTNDYWIVHYSINGIHLVDYWHYVRGRWRFNLELSNPAAAKLYRMSFGAYAKSVGCSISH